jgi:alpha-tubulin suppressor-like RCC1 family protein
MLGYDSQCVVNRTNKVLCWGKNGSHQLGDGTTIDRTKPVFPVGIEGNAVSVFGGYGDTFVFTEEGKTYRWGLIDLVTTTTGYPTPRDVTSFLTNATYVGQGTVSHCALIADGTVACWGLNRDGELGDGGQPSRTDPLPIPGFGSVVSVAVGYWHTCAAKSDGTVWCWGGNDSGQVGNGTFDDVMTPTQITIPKKVVQVGSRFNITCALTEDRKVWCWGPQPQGDTTHLPAPVLADGIDSVASIAVEDALACAIKTDGTLWCWRPFILVDGSSPVSDQIPTQISALGNDVVSVSAGYHSACAIRADGSLWCFGSDLGYTATPIKVAPGCN